MVPSANVATPRAILACLARVKRLLGLRANTGPFEAVRTILGLRVLDECYECTVFWNGLRGVDEAGACNFGVLEAKLFFFLASESAQLLRGQREVVASEKVV